MKNKNEEYAFSSEHLLGLMYMHLIAHDLTEFLKALDINSIAGVEHLIMHDDVVGERERILDAIIQEKEYRKQNNIKRFTRKRKNRNAK